MVGLRQKMLIGFGGLLLIITLLGIRSIIRVNDLGGAIQAILRENYRSVIACQEMKESLGKMNDGALLVLLGYRNDGIHAIRTNTSHFETELDIQLNNITISGEGDVASRLRNLFSQYKSKIREMEDETLSRTTLRKIYFEDLIPLFHEINNTSDIILSMNQQNMEQASLKAKAKAAQARQEMYILLLLGAAVSVAYIILIGKWILKPIKRLTKSVDEIRHGNLDLVMKSDSRDEIGHLSEAFNEMTASLRELRRSDEARLIRLQRSAQQTFDSLPDAVAIVDPDGHVEMATEKARNIFGLKLGVLIRDLPFKWMDELFQAVITHSLKPGQNKTLSIIQHFYNAEELYFRPMAVPVLDNFKQVTGAILILSDVTKQVEQNELKRNFISTVSHQLKTPLTSVRMALHILLEEKVGTLNPEQGDLLATAREDSDRLYGIIENLLDMDRIESGKTAGKTEAISPYQIVFEAIGSFKSAARDRGVELSTNLPDDLPDVNVDKAQIEQVFDNLLFNALKYTPSGGRISIAAETLQNFVWFIVADTGIGIPASCLPKIFDRFFRVPGQETRTGTGLGLAIVKEIIEAHGGAVRIESSEGKGSTFFFSLPRAGSIAS